MPRVASVWIPAAAGEEADGLTVALLAGGPRVMRAAPGLWRVDARGWARRGGEATLGSTLRDAAAREGFPEARVGIADAFVAADAAAGWPLRAPEGTPGVPGEKAGASLAGVRIVPPGEDRAFLASLPLVHLPVPEASRETLRTLGFRRIGEVAARPRSAWEARFGPEGLRVHRWACGEDPRRFRPARRERLPEASVELEGTGADRSDPLLFLLRHLLARVCGELEERGACAARLRLRLFLNGGGEEEARVTPARPTRREEMLFDLCRAALERRTFGDPPGREAARVTGLALAVERRAPAEARQGDLFVRRWRDPMRAAAVLSRLRARLGEEAVAVPDPRATHRPEARNRWRRVEASAGEGGEADSPASGSSLASDSPRAGAGREGAVHPGEGDDALSPVLRLAPEPRRVRVRAEGGRPVAVRDDRGRHEVLVAEGPERLSGDWWKDPYRREYYRLCTEEGELLWVFREYRPDGRFRWWLHGWWD